MEKFLQKILIDTKAREYYWANDFLAILTILSILAIVLETVPALSPYQGWFVFIEWFTVGVFLLEYVARLHLAKPSWKYAISFFGIIDLVSILPTILGLGNLTFLKSARAVRILRLLRLIRLAKITRRGSKKDIEESVGVVTLNLTLYIGVMFLATLLVGGLIYSVGTDTYFTSIPKGMLWSLELFLNIDHPYVPETSLGYTIFLTAKFLNLAPLES